VDAGGGVPQVGALIPCIRGRYSVCREREEANFFLRPINYANRLTGGPPINIFIAQTRRHIQIQSNAYCPYLCRFGRYPFSAESVKMKLGETGKHKVWYEIVNFDLNKYHMLNLKHRDLSFKRFLIV